MRELVKLLKVMTLEKKDMALATFLGFITSISSVGLMAAAAYLISLAALQPPLYTLTLIILAVRFFGLSRAGFRYLERYISHRATFSILGRLRVYFYDQIEPLAPALFAGYKKGDLLSRVVADVESLQYFFLRNIYPPLVMVLVFIVTGVLLSSFSIYLAIILTCGLLAVGVLLPLIFISFNQGLGRKIRLRRAQLSVEVTEVFFGYTDLKTNNCLTEKIGEIRKSSSGLLQAQQKAATLAGLGESLTVTLSFVTAWAMLVAAIWLVSTNAVSGVFLAMLVLASLTAFETTNPMATIPEQLEENKVAAQRLFSLAETGMAIETDPLAKEEPGHFSLQVNNLSFAYPNQERWALVDMNFTLEHGGKLAIVGASGSGKSTLVNLLLRFYDFRQGEIILGGRELEEYDPEQVRRYFGVVAQENHFFNDTVRANLLLAKPDATDQELAEVLKNAALEYLKLEQQIGELGSALSGGERQRLAIARMVLKDAPVLLLDEPTTSLDAITEREVQATLWQLIQDKSVIYITHSLLGMERMDKIILMDKGQVVEQGSLAELIEKKGCFNQLWQSEGKY
jgi:ATP-binding cassette subfamily C protein CydC